MEYQPPFTYTDEVGRLALEVAELVGRIRPDSDLATSPTLHRELRIRTIHSSLVIEGNRLSEDVVTAILDGKRVLGPEREIREVENAHRAYELIPILDPMSVDDLLMAHRTMMEGLIPDAGCLRSGDVGVFDGESLIHAGTPASLVPQVLSDLFGWLSSTDVHPLIASCVFHYELEFIHPFSDGNGRTGRMWHTLLLSRWRQALAWLPVETVIRERQDGYYAAIAQSNSVGSSEAFVEFMLRIIRDALAPYVMPDHPKERAERGALSFFARNPKGTISELANVIGCSKRSAERLVARLRAEGKVVRRGSPRAGTWVVADPDDLP